MPLKSENGEENNVYKEKEYKDKEMSKEKGNDENIEKGRAEKEACKKIDDKTAEINP